MGTEASIPRFALPKRHHIVPRLLLAQFTDTGGKQGALWAHDKETGKVWQTKPVALFVRKHFYSDPLRVKRDADYENWLSRHEGDVASDVRALGLGDAKLHDISLEKVLRFVAIQMVRHPRARVLGKGMTGLVGAAVWLFSGFKESAFGDMDPRELSDAATLELMEPVGELLAHFLGTFKWGLYRTEASSRGFVLCDTPVAVHSTHGGSWVGLFAADPVVYMPLSWRACLIGVRNGRRRHVRVGPRVVADVNGRLIEGSERMLCSRYETFYWFDAKDEWREGITLE